MKKKCKKCGLIKNSTEFYNHKTTKDKLYPDCKKCNNEKKLKWQQENPEKVKLTSKRHYDKNPEKMRELNKKYRKENPDKVKEQNKKYYEENFKGNSDKIREKNKRGYENNKENIIKTNRKWAKANQERVKKNQKKYYEENIERIKERDRMYRLNNIERYRENFRKRAREHPEKIREANRKIRVKRMNCEGFHVCKEFDILKEKTGNICLCCKTKESELKNKYKDLDKKYWKLTEDHIIPLAKGGSDFIDNIQPLCMYCNSVKNANIISLEKLRKIIYENGKYL